MTRCRIKDISLVDGAVDVDISVEGPEPVVNRLPIAARARAYRAVQVLYGSAATPADADRHPVEWDEVSPTEIHDNAHFDLVHGDEGPLSTGGDANA